MVSVPSHAAVFVAIIVAVRRAGLPRGERLHGVYKHQNGHIGVRSEVPVSIGGPSRTRTLDPLIKSQLLYQLS